jgi:phosphohistidine phosphatase
MNNKTLVIVRHAKSDWSVGVDDFNRPLNDRGRKDAPRMGKYLKQIGLKPDTILTSSATRAKHTAQLLAHELHFPITDIIANESLYHASPQTILSAINRIPTTCDTLFVFGHNPGLSELVSKLTDEYVELKTCCVATLDCGVDEWGAVFWGGCKMTDYFSPKSI